MLEMNYKNSRHHKMATINAHLHFPYLNLAWTTYKNMHFAFVITKETQHIKTTSQSNPTTTILRSGSLRCYLFNINDNYYAHLVTNLQRESLARSTS